MPQGVLGHLSVNNPISAVADVPVAGKCIDAKYVIRKVATIMRKKELKWLLIHLPVNIYIYISNRH